MVIFHSYVSLPEGNQMWMGNHIFNGVAMGKNDDELCYRENVNAVVVP